ncbi:hypothetical protein PRIEUP_LOCUS1718, partial [Pristimantis euphronides]
MNSTFKKTDSFDEANGKTLLEAFYSSRVPHAVYQETAVNVMEAFYKAFSTGKVTGNIVIDLRLGPIIVHLLAIKDFVQEITLLVLNDAILKDLEKWKNKDPGAYSWSHATGILKKLTGNRFSIILYTFTWCDINCANFTVIVMGNYDYNFRGIGKKLGRRIQPEGKHLHILILEQNFFAASSANQPPDLVLSNIYFIQCNFESLLYISENFDFSSVNMFYCTIDKCEDEEDNLREKIKILKCDLRKDIDVGSLVIPSADCITSILGLEKISKDCEDYRRNLRRISYLIKLGGYFLCYTAINCTYFKLGEDKFHFLHCDMSFYRKVLTEEGFEIVHCERFDRQICFEISDYEGTAFIIARKVKEP